MDNLPRSSAQSMMNPSTKLTFSGADPLSLSIKGAQEKKISETRDFFEQLITDYPTCGRFWKIYIEQELKARNFERVEKLFQRSLIKVLNIDLWKCYLNYVRDTKLKMSNYKEKTAQAYDFALEKIGLDVMSYSIWVDYVNFLKSVEASGSFAENQKITAIRKVYQKGVMNPMINVDQLWKDYCSFENQISPLIAKRMIDDRSKEFMSVRRISKEYENITRNLDRNSPCFPPQGTQEELKQKSLWKKYIQWEKSNPLKSEDNGLVAKRVMFAIEQSLLSMATHPDIHFEAVNYLQQMSSTMAEKCEATASRHYSEEAVAMFERSIKSFMKTNMLMYFAYADYEESRLNYTKVSQIYDRLLEIQEVDPSLCYIQYMRFLRRAEGIRSARAIFKRARDDQRISYHVFIAAAFMEYFCTKDKTIAYKIFQLGAVKFGHLSEYVKAFIEFTFHMNDDETIRSLFNNMLSGNQLPKEKAGDIWSEWLNFESNAGEISNIMGVVEKRNHQYEETNQLDERQTILIIDRYKFLNLYPCNLNELNLLGYKDSMNFLSNSSAQNTSSSASTSTLGIISASSNNLIINSDETIGEKYDPNAFNPFNKLSSRKQNKYPSPNPAKMFPFKPNRNAFSGLQPIAGGGLFLFPSCFSEMVKRLPPPTCFDGPYVMIDDFLNHFKNLDLPEDYQTFYNKLNESQNENKQLPSLSKIQSNNRETQFFNILSTKRPYQQNGDTNSDDDDNLASIHIDNNIYKQRHQKKQIKHNA